MQVAIRESHYAIAANRIFNSGKVGDAWNLAYVYHVRSTAKFNIIKIQGGTDISDALRDNDESMRLNPNYALHRALQFEAVGRMGDARYWQDLARELREAKNESVRPYCVQAGPF